MSSQTPATLSQINVYPVKSTKGLSLSNSYVEKQGLTFDRRFMIAKPDGTMITARSHPELVMLTSDILQNGLQLGYSGKPSLRLNFSEFIMDEQACQVWNDSFVAYKTTYEADQWISDVLEEEVQLLYTGEQSTRVRTKVGHNVSFADGYPLLIISEASLAELNARSTETQHMQQFRPNIVVSGNEAFIEDSWKRIQIGEVEFEIKKPCQRCVLTTVDYQTGHINPSREPISTLSKFRADPQGGTYFGQNMVALNEGSIRVGDTIKVLETKPKEFYEDNGRDNIKLTCVAKEDTAREFVTYWFEPTVGILPNYLSGQYLPIQIIVNDKMFCRHYTLSSSPSRLGRYAISVKRVDGGKVSNWLLDNMVIGDVLETDSPQGHFHLNHEQDRPLLLLSAGSGVTPMISMLRYLADNEQMDNVVFYHQCSTVDDIPFRTELEALNRQFEGLKVIISLSQANQQWQGDRGRLSLAHIKRIPDLSSRQAFVCGPTGFMQKAKQLLIKNGLPESQYHQESFEVSVSAQQSFKEVTISLNGVQIQGDNQTSLLQQVEKAGQSIANSCRAGLCGACKVTLETGEVEHADVPALSDEDRKMRHILACCSVPKTDVEIVN